MKKEIRELLRAANLPKKEAIADKPLKRGEVVSVVSFEIAIRGGAVKEIVEPMKRAADVVRNIVPAEFFDDEVIDRSEVGYMHPVFLQCFLPTRHTVRNREEWQANHRRASLLLRAGVLIDPDRPNNFKKCIVPAGARARIVNAYANDYILKYRTPTVDLGHSLRKAMHRMKMPYGGKNGQLLQRKS